MMLTPFLEGLDAGSGWGLEFSVNSTNFLNVNVKMAEIVVLTVKNTNC